MVKGYPVSPTVHTMEDAAYLALADQRRRNILVELLDGSIDIAALADDSADPDQRVTVALHHRHLPMLADEGYISWDRSTEAIERGPRFDVIQPLLEGVIQESDAGDPSPSVSVD